MKLIMQINMCREILEEYRGIKFVYPSFLITSQHVNEHYQNIQIAAHIVLFELKLLI